MDLLEEIQRKATHINTLDELKERLTSGKPLRVKYGIDPTNPSMHLGHTVPLRLLYQLQKAGHKAIIVLGDFTAALGDPTGRDKLREGIKLEEARKNAQDYVAQLRCLINLDTKVCEIHRNSGWLERYTTADWLEKMRHWTLQQITDRDDFKNRMANGNGVHLNEIMYTLFQGEDSVRVKADIELGGQEQLFTLMIGREMQKQAGQQPQVCIALPILCGLDGQKRMGKSLNNFIAIKEEPFEMFSKVMSIPDSLIREWTNLLTDSPIPPPGVSSIGEAIKELECREKVLAGEKVEWVDDFGGVGPMTAKKMLAHQIVRWLHSEDSPYSDGAGWDIADKARDRWHKQFTLHECPDDVREVPIGGGNVGLYSLVHVLGLVTSKSIARRLVEQGAVTVNGEKITDPFAIIELVKNPVIKCGRQFARVKYVNDQETSKEV